MPDVFISYSSKDAAYAEKMLAALENAGLSVWMAPLSIHGGEDWATAIMRGIKSVKKFLILVSSNTMGSQNVFNELTAASNRSIDVIPFRLEDVELAARFEYHLQSRHWENQPVQTSIESAMERAARWIRQQVDDGDAPAETGDTLLTLPQQSGSMAGQRAPEIGACAEAPQSQRQPENRGGAGKGVLQDAAQQVAGLQESAAKGDAAAQYELAVRYADGRDVEASDVKAVHWLKESVKNGNENAMIDLAERYFQGRGVTADADRGEALLVKAAETDDGAKLRLGKRYLDGNGVKKREEEGFRLLREAAESGRKDAVLQLAYCLETGRGTEKDAAQAVALYERFADSDADAQFRLGYCYCMGTGVEKDGLQAVYYLELAAAQGAATAMHNLGVMYERGEGVNKDGTKAYTWYLRGAEAGYAADMAIVAQAYRTGAHGFARDAALAFEWAGKGAEAGNVNAQILVCDMLLKGEGVPANAEEAYASIQRASARNNAAAQWRQAEMLWNGRGVAQDKAEAARLYERSAQQGYWRAQRDLALILLGVYAGGPVDAERGFSHLQAAALQSWDKTTMLRLAKCYYDGTGTDRDVGKALDLYEKFADSDADAQFRLGYCYDTGNGVEKDGLLAMKYYELAAAQGTAAAMHNLGVMYGRGSGVTKDDAKAYAWYRKGAEAGYAVDMHLVATAYRKGVYGFPKDAVLAYEWARKGAEAGNIDAQILVGDMLENGEGTPASAEDAYAWIQRAAERNNKLAQWRQAEMLWNGRGVAQDREAAVRRYEDSAKQGYRQAQRELGMILLGKRAGARIDAVRGFAYLKQAAETAADKETVLLLAQCYYDGTGTDRDVRKALELYEKYADSDAAASFRLGYAYHAGKDVARDYEKAAHFFELAAAQGIPAAMHNLGVMYGRGSGVTKDDVKAYAWHRKGAEAGDADDMRIVAQAYRTGAHGFSKDAAQAYAWMRKAADAGDGKATLTLAQMLVNGEGVEKNEAEAYALFARLAADGDAEACQQQAWMLWEGKGAKKDRTESMRLWKISADKGNANACAELGARLIGNAKGSPCIDLPRGREYLEKAVKGRVAWAESLVSGALRLGRYGYDKDLWMSDLLMVRAIADGWNVLPFLRKSCIESAFLTSGEAADDVETAWRVGNAEKAADAFCFTAGRLLEFFDDLYKIDAKETALLGERLCLTGAAIARAPAAGQRHGDVCRCGGALGREVLTRTQSPRLMERMADFASGIGTPVPLGRETVTPPERRRVARNDPCPCGSGKKYKDCCGAERPE